MDSKKKMTGMMIHGFAVAHAVAAALLAQTLVGDEAVLTALTIAMIIAVAKMNGADWDTGAALAFLGICIGGYVGVRGATFLVKVIPGVGNVCHAAALRRWLNREKKEKPKKGIPDYSYKEGESL